MTYFKHIPIDKIKGFLRLNPKLIGFIAVILSITGIYLFSHHEDQKVMSYQNKVNQDFTDGRILTSSNDIYQKKEKALSTKFEELEKQIKDLNEVVKLQRETKNESKTLEKHEEESLSPSPIVFQAPTTPYEVKKIDNYPQQIVSNYPPPQQDQIIPPPIKIEEKGPLIISFPVKTKTETSLQASVIIPSGSFVKAKLLTGVEAPEGKTLPVLLQADYAFVGPNRSRIDLAGCFLIAKSTGNLSIERVEMQASKISCVSKTGRTFEREINGFIADNKDNSFAVIGDVNSKQDRVASMAFLSSIVAGISGAISQAQTTSTTNGAGSVSNVLTGDEQKYLAANGAGNAANIVTQWYLKHAQSLLPTINVGSGQDVWIVVQDSVELPNWYFKKIPSQKSGFEFLSKLAE